MNILEPEDKPKGLIYNGIQNGMYKSNASFLLSSESIFAGYMVLKLPRNIRLFIQFNLS